MDKCRWKDKAKNKNNMGRNGKSQEELKGKIAARVVEAEEVVLEGCLLLEMPFVSTCSSQDWGKLSTF